MRQRAAPSRDVLGHETGFNAHHEAQRTIMTPFVQLLREGAFANISFRGTMKAA